MSEEGDASRTQSPDTSPEAEAMLLSLWRAMEPWQKFALLSSLQRMADGAAVVGILQRHPDADDEELRRRFFALRYGRELALEHFGWDPHARGW